MTKKLLFKTFEFFFTQSTRPKLVGFTVLDIEFVHNIAKLSTSISCEEF